MRQCIRLKEKQLKVYRTTTFQCIAFHMCQLTARVQDIDTTLCSDLALKKNKYTVLEDANLPRKSTNPQYGISFIFNYCITIGSGQSKLLV